MYLSYLIDKYFFGLDIKMMHLHNVLLHILNAMLLFFITKNILLLKKHDKKDILYVPLLVSLTFGLHPIVTEPVNWISGRTDLLAGFFVFLGVYLFLQFILKGKIYHLLFSLLSGTLAMLAKEVAVVYFLVLFLIFILAPIDIKRKKRGLLILLFVFISMFLLYLLMRGNAFQAPDVRIKRTLLFINANPKYFVIICFRVIGFYVKKFFYPFPLNFTILDVDPLYDLLGMAIVFFLLIFVLRKSFVGIFFVTGVIFLTPAILIAMRAIAWTPYAERYMYVATGFFSISFVLWLSQFVKTEKFRIATFIILLIALSVGTFQRNNIWRDYKLLLEDSIRKEPSFRETRLEYGSLLLDRGKYEEARSQFVKATKIFSLGYDPRAYLVLSEIDYLEGKYDSALNKVNEIINRLKKIKKSTKNALSLKVKILQKLLLTGDKMPSHYNELMDTARRFCELESNPYVLYYTGKSLLKTESGYYCLHKAYEIFKDKNEYKSFTAKLINRYRSLKMKHK